MTLTNHISLPNQVGAHPSTDSSVPDPLENTLMTETELQLPLLSVHTRRLGPEQGGVSPAARAMILATPFTRDSICMGTPAMRLSHRTRASDSCRSPPPQLSRSSKRAAPPFPGTPQVCEHVLVLVLFLVEKPLGLVLPADSPARDEATTLAAPSKPKHACECIIYTPKQAHHPS